MDKLNIPFITKNLKADALVAINSSQDQLDRVREIEQPIVKMKQATSDFEGVLILNGSDSNIVQSYDAVSRASMLTFGMEHCSLSNETIGEASEGKSCP